MTPEARQAFIGADVALYLVTDAVAQAWIAKLNPNSHSLQDHYTSGKPRQQIYDEMTERILREVRAGSSVCAAFYGHPGVFVYPSHAAIRQARSEGYTARMLPGVSAEDCLFSDLGVDPGESGCQSYEATDFLIRRRQVDPTAALLLWQVAVIGERIYSTEAKTHGLAVLADYLRTWYADDHAVTLYMASPYPLVESAVRHLTLGELSDTETSALATLYVPPLEPRPRDPEMMERLGLGSA
jgi:uncharacterized protein YabN with tetrapyrrole methylase and pyrophosphatase domain